MLRSHRLLNIFILLSCLNQYGNAFSLGVSTIRSHNYSRFLVMRKADLDDITDDRVERVNYFQNTNLSRRRFFNSLGPSFVVGVIALVFNAQAVAEFTSSNTETGVTPKQAMPITERIEPIDIQKVAEENKINIALKVKDENAKVYIDRNSYDMLKERTFPSWVPRFLLPKPQSIGRVSDIQLLMASAIAGSFTEVARSSILYPIATVKTRIQADTPSSSSLRSSPPKEHDSELTESMLSFQEIVKDFVDNLKTQFKRGDFYIGFFPSLIASVPAAGVYFAVNDIMKKEIRQLSESSSFLQVDDFSIILLSILVADVVSLAVRTPAVIFSVRRQAEPQVEVTKSTAFDYCEDVESDLVECKQADHQLEQLLAEQKNFTKNKFEMLEIDSYDNDTWWDEMWKDCWRQLPTIIITDLPYLLIKISLVRFLAEGNENIAQYGALNIFAACLASAVTTPFDVARTVILVDSDNNKSNGLDGGSMEGVFEAMQRIAFGFEYQKEVEGGKNNAPPIREGIKNLYAGWFERVCYFAIGIAWLEPLRILSYYAVRDVLLLGIFP